ncbi:hypothetical protein AX14_010041, partial [Amanita brunnescens Koide BX004]
MYSSLRWTKERWTGEGKSNASGSQSGGGISAATGTTSGIISFPGTTAIGAAIASFSLGVFL